MQRWCSTEKEEEEATLFIHESADNCQVEMLAEVPKKLQLQMNSSTSTTRRCHKITCKH